ncbi:hypothetical protein MMPV_006531 [Pyropia vietnamensis]
MGVFRVECTLPLPADLFWSLRDTPAFLKWIVDDHLLNSITSTPPAAHDTRPGVLTRTQSYIPATVACPDMLRPLVGSTAFAVTDHQTWSASVPPYTLDFKITPSFLTALSSTSGSLTIVPGPAADAVATPEADAAVVASPTADAADVCAHIVDGTATVRVPYLGGYVEKAIVDNLQAFYALYPGCVGRFCAWLVEAYGTPADGPGVDGLRAAASRYLDTLGGGLDGGCGDDSRDATRDGGVVEASAATAAAAAAAAAAMAAGGVVHHVAGEPPLPGVPGKAAAGGGSDSDGDVRTGLAEGDTISEEGGISRIHPPTSV